MQSILLTIRSTLQVGPYRAAIPPQSFRRDRSGFVFEGTVGGADLKIQIVPMGGVTYQFYGAGGREWTCGT